MFQINCFHFLSSANVLIKTCVLGEKLMQIQTKLFSWPDKGNHVIMIARGVLDARGLEQIPGEVAAVAIPHLDCKVLIDLVDADCKVELIDALLHESRPDLWPRQCRTALVSSFKDEQHSRLQAVSTTLASGGFRIAVFRNSKSAVDWLTNPI